MEKIKRISLGQALTYKGGSGMWSWILHRITGLGILLFVGMHIVAAFFVYSIDQGWVADMMMSITTWYESVPVQIFVLFSVLFHALNGLRIIIMDFWPSLMRYRKELLWLQLAIFVPLFLLPSILMIMPAE